MKTHKTLYLLMITAIVLLSGCRDEVRAESYFTDLEEKILLNEPPDVGFVDTLRAPSYIQKGYLKEIPRNWDTSDFYPQLLPYFQKDGKTYALPRDFQTMALLVNLDLFEEAGIRLPVDWDGFKRAAAAITDPARGIYGVGLTSGFFNIAPFLLQADPYIYDEKTNTLNLQSDGAQYALSYYVDLYRNGYVYDPQGGWPYMGIYDKGGMIDQFVAGKIGMFLLGPSMYDQVLQRSGDDLHMQVIELPAGPFGKATLVYAVGFGFFKEPTEPALEFLHYTISPEGMQIWYDPQGLGIEPKYGVPPVYMPARMSLREAWLTAHPDTQAFMAGINYLPQFPILRAPFVTITNYDLQASVIIYDVLAERLTIDEALLKLEEIGTALVGD